MRARGLAILFVIMMLTGCSRQQLIDRIVDKDMQRFAVTQMENIRAGQFDRVILANDRDERSRFNVYAAASRDAMLAAPGPFVVVSAIARRSLRGDRSAVITLQSGSGSHWLLGQISVHRIGTGYEVVGLTVRPTASDIRTTSNFELNQRGVAGYVFLTIMALCTAVSAYALYLIWHRRWLRRRWLWTLGSLLGFSGLGINWASGDVFLLFINICIPPFRAVRFDPLGPWMLSFGIPVVALIVIAKWRARETGTLEDPQPA